MANRSVLGGHPLGAGVRQHPQLYIHFEGVLAMQSPLGVGQQNASNAQLSVGGAASVSFI